MLLLEDAKVHAAVFPMFYEMRMLGEIVVLTVFEDEDAAGLEEGVVSGEW